MFSKPIEFLAIGDMTTDAFIRLSDAHINCNVDKESCELCMKFGAKIPYESVTVVRASGNGVNAAVGAARLGLRTALISNVGDDENGEECIDSLKKERVETRFVSVNKGLETNYHYVLWYGTDRTILVKHQDFLYHLPRALAGSDASNAPKWVYISSLAGSSYEYQMTIVEWLKKNPAIKVAFQPGTFQISIGVEKLGELYRRSDILFCNKQEAQKILKTEEKDVKKLLVALRAIGPKIVVVTDGAIGAYADDGANAYFMLPYPDPRAPLERTGAGDAFSSTFTVALALGKSFEEALMLAPINSASVVQEIGAQKGLLTRAKLEEWLSKAPADYKTRKI